MAKLSSPPIVNSAPFDIRVVSATSDTLQSSDAGSAVQYTSASAITVTIPQSTLASGESVEIIQAGAGAVSVVAGSAVTLRVPLGFSAQCGGQYAIAVVYHVGSEEFVLGGRLAASP